MSKAITIGITGVVLSFAMLAFGFIAGSQSGSQASTPAVAQSEAAPETLARGDVEQIVRDYLMANPEILTEMQVVLEERQREQQRVAQEEAIKSDSGVIFNAAYDGVIGNPEGSVTVVEFFDYNCGFCKRAMEDMQTVVAEDADVRFVLKEFPILGPDSLKAHVVSMAFRALAPEKYGEFHQALLSGERATEEAAIEIALSLGADEAALRQEMTNPAITEAFNATYALADKLRITGTPSYVVGQEVVFGALGQEVLREKVELARACASGDC